jgi:drug/metabolite transporter (DMT)-like permease
MKAISPNHLARKGRIDPRLIASLAAVYVIWSSTYLAMKIAVAELPPLLMASARFGSAGLVLLVVARRRGASWPRRVDWIAVFPIGALMFVGGNGFVAISQLSVTSGGTAVVSAMMPLWIGIVGWWSGERPSRREWSSVVLGLFGIIVLMEGPSLAGEPLHLGLLILAPLCWAMGSILARKLTGPVATDMFLLPAVQMITGAIALCIVGLGRGETLSLDVSATAWAALGYLWIFGSLIAFTAYTWLLRNTRPVIATSYAYVNPGLAVVLGAVISGEPLGWTTLVALILMIIAIWLAISGRALRQQPATKPSVDG